LSLFATAPAGLEDLLAAELAGLGADDVHTASSGAAFRADLEAAYRVCLWSRLANRVLLPLAEFEAEDSDQLYAGVAHIDWRDHVRPDCTLAVRFTGIRPSIGHSRYAEQRVKDAICDQLRERFGQRPSVDPRQPDIRIGVHMQRHRVSIAIDLSGDSLHQRGYRAPGHRAPLKENLAAAMLLRADWPALAANGASLVDPMCGSGTLVIEAALMAADCAPGMLRSRFGFLAWPGHHRSIWKGLIDEAIERRQHGLAALPKLVGLDRDASAIALARANAARADLAKLIDFSCADFSSVRPPGASGLLVTNPPWGERIGQAHELAPLYWRLGQTIKQHFRGWRAMLLNASDCEIGLKPERVWRLKSGPIDCRLERFEIQLADPVTMRESAAIDLVNRLIKNRRRLARWRRREDVSCYRLYDADLPEYALAIDVYGQVDGDWLHVQEYQAPATIDPGRARARLRAALSALPEALEVDPARLVFKVRQRQRGRSQYTRQDQQGQRLVVEEGRCRLYVNLTDYLDTGLFLDHRPMRRWIGEHAGGKRVLNLFSYTGAASVHAALGGGHTTSVDLSRGYLAWLTDNFRLNNIDPDSQRIVRADCLDWLSRHRERYDLIFLDPPSFSNSQRMRETLDIQRDHGELLDLAGDRLSTDGLLIFSANRKGFALDPAIGQKFNIEEVTQWSVPPDFQRKRRIHRCWFLRRNPSSLKTPAAPSGSPLCSAD